MKCIVALTFVAALGLQAANASGVPRPGPEDPRVRVVTYSPLGVTVVKVKRGTGTRIVLDAEERILDSAPGFSSDCKSATDEWCIAAPIGGNQVFVRPRDNAQRNNIEIRTDKRDYSIELIVLPDDTPGKKGGQGEAPFFRVVFEYPKTPAKGEPTPEAIRAALLQAVQATSQQATAAPPSTEAQARTVLKQQVPAVRNASYSMQVLEKGEDAAPSMVFDDGRFTYFEFGGNREVPAIFAFGSDDQATRVNWHMEAPFVVVHRTARKFVLRLGGAVVGVYNEAFDRLGLETPNGSPVEAVVRDAKEVVVKGERK
jgi:type IV secretion system protein VirB9